MITPRDEARRHAPQAGKWAFRCVIAGAVIVLLLAILEMLP